ncbi:hypothetical protein NDU88_006105 [Pleurodeles waltl]|uniref:Uncharacterized protein n=1 Tax=Pleurodeles waltl TaxID=8319 RepID=A0AAV7VQE9_PLEWA|nr:hypothetical protein NDU88_006105 [Pleurodeles waltl]
MFSEWASALETTMQTLAPAAQLADHHLSTYEAQTKRLAVRLNDMEGLAQYNIYIVGLPENAEGDSLLFFLETWLQEVVAHEGQSNFYALEREHRVQEPRCGALACPLVACLHGALAHKIWEWWVPVLQNPWNMTACVISSL